MWNDDQARSSCLQLDYTHARPDACGAVIVGACAGAAAEPGADQRGQIRLSGRLSRSLRQRPARRAGLARLPAEESREPLAGLPIGGERDRGRGGRDGARWRPAGSGRSSAGACRRCCRARDAGAPLSSDVAAPGDCDPSLFLWPRLSGSVWRRSARRRTRRRLPQGECGAALSALPRRADAGGGPQVERGDAKARGLAMRTGSRNPMTIRLRSRPA